MAEKRTEWEKREKKEKNRRDAAPCAVNPVSRCRRGEVRAGVAEVSSLFIDLLNSANRGPRAPARLKRAGSFRD